MIDHGKVIAEGTPAQLKAVGRRRRAAGAPARPRAATRGRARAGPRARRGPPRARSGGALGLLRRSRARRRGDRRACPLGNRDRGLLTRPAQPRRGLPRAHRATRRRTNRSRTRRSRRRRRDEQRADDRRPRRHRRGGGAAQGARLHPAPAARERGLGGAHLRLARDAQGQARSRAAARRDDHPGDVRAPVHLPVRRRDRRLDRRVPRLHPPRDPGDVGPVHHRLLGGRAQHRPDPGRRRPLPLAADLEPAHRWSGPCSATASATCSRAR